MAFGRRFLAAGEAPGRQGEEQRRDAGEEPGPAGAGRGTEQEQKRQGERKGQEKQRQARPGVGRQQVVHLPGPGLEDEFRDLVDAVLRLRAGELQVVPDVRVRRIQPEAGRSSTS